MNPQEMFLAVRAFVGMVEKSAEEPESLAKCSQIFLPSRDRRLLPSTELIFDDDIQLKRRLSKLEQPFVINRWPFMDDSFEYTEKKEILQSPRLSKFFKNSPRLSKFFKNLPEHLKCINLQDAVEEIMEGQVTTENENHADMVEEIKIKLRDPRFTQALLRLLRHQEIVIEGEKDETNPAEQEKQIKNRNRGRVGTFENT